jgi:hypothetical protein
MKKIKNLYPLFILACGFITAFITFYSGKVHKSNPIDTVNFKIKEDFDSTLIRIQSLGDLEKEIAKRLNNNFKDTGKILDTLDFILRKRFYHSFSEFTLNENWIAKFVGKTIWSDLGFKVNPEDILKGAKAACSQQSLIFQAMCQRYGINYGVTSFGHTPNYNVGHFAVNAFYGNEWHYFDTNLEPLKVKGNPSVDKLLKDSILSEMYKNTDYYEFMKEKIAFNAINKLHNINKYSARNALLFHRITDFLSDWLWLILVIYGSILYFQKPLEKYLNVK